MPKDTMEKAIKKGAGELEGQSFSEALYEGTLRRRWRFLLDVLPTIRTERAQEIRHTLSKYGGIHGGKRSSQLDV